MVSGFRFENFRFRKQEKMTYFFSEKTNNLGKKISEIKK